MDTPATHQPEQSPTLVTVDYDQDHLGCSGAVPEPGDGVASGELCAHTSWVDRSAFSGETLAGPIGPNQSSEKNQTRQGQQPHQVLNDFRG